MEADIVAQDPELDGAILVALGSNLPGAYGAPAALLEAALARFSEVGLRVRARSRWWRSAAWPDRAAPGFVNGVAWVESEIAPHALLAALRRLERAFGRRRGAPNAPRTLDLDLIACGRRVIDSSTLTLPHPRAHERGFVMGPLAEIAPGWRHPVLGRTAAELARDAKVGRDAAPVEM